VPAAPINRELVVVGAGPVGLTLALLAVRRAGIPAKSVIVCDRRLPTVRDPRELADAPLDLRVFALSRASERVLRACDAWESMRAVRISPYERMQVWHADVPPHAGDALVFDAAEAGEPDLGAIVENTLLQTSLLAAATRAGIELVEADLSGLAIESDHARLSFGSHDISARLAVGADGAQSRLRELAGLGATRADYGQTAVVAMVATAREHQRTAWQRFLGDGTLAFLPLADGRTSIVWSVPTARAAELVALAREDFERALTREFDDALGAVRLESERLTFPLWRLTAEHYVAERVALVGDAAHVVHPLAGQGANLGLLDAAALADVLARGRAEREDPGALRLLRGYERWRRSENELMSHAIDAFDQLLARGTGRIAAVAQRALPWVARSGLAKRAIMERAMGLTGDLPSAARRASRV
jgi:2-polyprenylphenol 6-hydroxylase